MRCGVTRLSWTRVAVASVDYCAWLKDPVSERRKMVDSSNWFGRRSLPDTTSLVDSLMSIYEKRIPDYCAPYLDRYKPLIERLFRAWRWVRSAA